MSRTLDVRPLAERDLRQAYAWYEQQNPGLGGSFLEEVEHNFERVRSNPELYPILYRDVHRAIMRRFPYGIFYRVDESAVRILAVFHTARDPADWPTHG